MTAPSKWRTAVAAVAASAAFAAVPVLGAQPAHAQYPPPSPGLTLSSTAVYQGAKLAFIGRGFASEQAVVAELLPEQTRLGNFRANRVGAVWGSVRIPRCTTPGNHVFRLRASNPDRILEAGITVLERPGDDPCTTKAVPKQQARAAALPAGQQNLADTGDDKTPLLMGGAAGLAALGGGGVLLARRLRKH
ncbi:LPXTG cell wall anchor domain-containing protein [Streptomyces xinghaiensis]|uniref:LPXTG cell wall anchor domain-containing protein n=1 Tax=Streptomyces xinghaiensis TaxID=1038928 RepID=UPI00342BE987